MPNGYRHDGKVVDPTVSPLGQKAEPIGRLEGDAEQSSRSECQKDVQCQKHFPIRGCAPQLRQAQHIPSPRFRRGPGPVQVWVHQQVAVGLADGVEDHRHGVGGGVPHVPLVAFQLARHALEDDGVQVPQPGAHIGPGQDGFPDAEAVRVKQPLDGVGCVLDDDLDDGLHQVFVVLNLAEAVPGIAVRHVQEVKKGIDHPDGGNGLTLRSKDSPVPQADGVDEHTVKVPGRQPQREIELPFSFVLPQRSSSLAIWVDSLNMDQPSLLFQRFLRPGVAQNTFARQRRWRGPWN